MQYLLYVLIPLVAVIPLIAAGYVKSPPDTAYIISGFRKPRILIVNSTNQITEGISSGMGIDIKSLLMGALGGKLISDAADQNQE